MQIDLKIRRAKPEYAAAVAACVRTTYEMYLDRMDTPPGPMLQD